MMHSRVVLFATQLAHCLGSYKNSASPDGQLIVDLPLDKPEVLPQSRSRLEAEYEGDRTAKSAGKHTAPKLKDAEKPIPLEAKNGNPVQISLIITNGAKQTDAKGSGASGTQKKETASRQKLSEMLLKPNPVTQGGVLGKDDVLGLIKLNNEIKGASLKIQKMSESSNKILKKSINFTDTPAQEDLVNYHVIEITENKGK